MQPLEGIYAGIFPGMPEQIANVRGQVREFLDGCPAADDAVLIISELAANAALHSLSRGSVFTVRVKRYGTCVYLEVEDAGGPWILAAPMTVRTGWTSSARWPVPGGSGSLPGGSSGRP
jgi:hypothetical protein